MLPRELKISLVFAGGSPDVAYLHNSKYTIDDYERALETDEYKEFAKEVNRQFIENADLRILGNLYRIEQNLNQLLPDDRTYPQVLKAYTELLKLTAPIVERLSKVKVETNMFEGLRLVITGPEN